MLWNINQPQRLALTLGIKGLGLNHRDYNRAAAEVNDFAADLDGFVPVF